MSDAGEIYKTGETTERSGRSELGIRGGIGRGGERKISHQLADDRIPKLLEQLADRRPLLLILDEIQALEDKLGSPEQALLTENLGRIHNGRLAKSVVLACGGLGISSQVFAHFRISRFKSDCLVNLGRLSETSERAVIRDWLVKDGGAREADILPWITAIAQETHGWPQHIAIYAQTAAKRLKARRGQATPEDLEAILKQGRENKTTYHNERIEYLDISGVRVLAALLQQAPISGSLNLEQPSLTRKLVETGGMSQQAAEQFFNSALHKGILSNAGTRTRLHYDVPIPSMKAFLVEEFGV